jgi:hypothetical protein
LLPSDVEIAGLLHSFAVHIFAAAVTAIRKFNLVFIVYVFIGEGIYEYFPQQLQHK